EPSAKGDAIRRVERDRLSPGQANIVRRGQTAEREVNEPPRKCYHLHPLCAKESADASDATRSGRPRLLASLVVVVRPDDRGATSRIHCTGAALQHGQTENPAGQTGRRRHRGVSRSEHLLRDGERWI